MSMMLRRPMLFLDNSLIPSEYQQVAYIECSGTQYIVTGYKLTADYAEIEWAYMLTATQSGDGMMFGCRDNSNAKVIQAELYDNARWYAGSGSAVFSNVLGYNSQMDTGRDLNTIYSAKMNGETITVNGYSANKTSTKTGSANTPLHIFAWKSGNSVQYINKGMRLYSLTFTEDGIMTANFIPCFRKADGAVGLYDVIAEAFYGNSGSGELIKGYNV